MIKAIYTSLFYLISFLLSIQLAYCCEDLSSDEAINKDGSIISFAELCVVVDGSEKNIVELYWQDNSEDKKQKIHTFDQWHANFENLNNDGFWEVVVTSGPGAGANSWAEFYQINPETKQLVLMLAEGYFESMMIDEFFVTSGRSSCCAWEYHAYDFISDTKQPLPLGYEKESYVINVRVAGTAEKEVIECQFQQRQDGKLVTVNPPNDKWLKICEHYSEPYQLVLPESEKPS